MSTDIDKRVRLLARYKEWLLNDLAKANQKTTRDLKEHLSEIALIAIDDYRDAANMPVKDLVTSNGTTLQSIYQRLQDDPGTDILEHLTYDDLIGLVALHATILESQSDALTTLEILLDERIEKTPV